MHTFALPLELARFDISKLRQDVLRQAGSNPTHIYFLSVSIVGTSTSCSKALPLNFLYYLAYFQLQDFPGFVCFNSGLPDCP